MKNETHTFEGSRAMKIAEIGTMIDSSGTGAGCLVNEKPASGFYATYAATAVDGASVEVVTEHLWNSDGALVKATAEVDGRTVTGEVIDVLMHDLLQGYIEQKLGEVCGAVLDVNVIEEG